MTGSAPSSGRASTNRQHGATVFVLMEQGANEAVVRETLSQWYHVVTPDDGIWPEEFDLCLLDDYSLALYEDRLKQHKVSARPLFLPYLLVTDRPDEGTVPGSVWRQVDDVVHTPLSRAAMYSRITTQMRTRALSNQFARSEARFAALIETATDAVFIIDEKGTVVFANPAVEVLFGYDRRELVGQSVTVLIPERFRQAATVGIGRTFASGESGPVDSIETRALHRDGHEVPVRLSYNRFRYHDRTFIAGIVHDVTDLIYREQRLQVLNRVLRHDIRNHINVVQGWAERLQETDTNATQYARYIEEKAHEIAHLSEQARQLEQLVRSADDELRTVDLRARVAEQVDRLRRDNPIVEVSVSLPARADVVSFDIVDSAIDNVLTNAVDHNDATRPAVDVQLAAVEPGWVELRIADNGPGIPAAELDAFERGTEGALTHTSGLGLWLTRWIVTESGGTVQFEENSPTGTVVRLRFRAADVRADD